MNPLTFLRCIFKRDFIDDISSVSHFLQLWVTSLFTTVPFKPLPDQGILGNIVRTWIGCALEITSTVPLSGHVCWMLKVECVRIYKGWYKVGAGKPSSLSSPPPEILRQKIFPICSNNFPNFFNRLYPFLKLFEGLMILNTKTKNLV